MLLDQLKSLYFITLKYKLILVNYNTTLTYNHYNKMTLTPSLNGHMKTKCLPQTTNSSRSSTSPTNVCSLPLTSATDQKLDIIMWVCLLEIL